MLLAYLALGCLGHRLSLFENSGFLLVNLNLTRFDNKQQAHYQLPVCIYSMEIALVQNKTMNNGIVFAVT